MNDRAAGPGPTGSGGSRHAVPQGSLAEGDFRALAENLPGVVARIDRGLALLYLNRTAREAFGPAPWPWWPALREAAARVFDTRRAQCWHFEAGTGAQRSRHSGRIVPELDGATFETVLALAVEDDCVRDDRPFAALAHELRSPLNAIQSWTYVLENHLAESDPTVRRALAGIMIGVEQQVRIIEGMPGPDTGR